MFCQAEHGSSPTPNQDEVVTKMLESAWELERDAAQLSRGLRANRSWEEIALQSQQLVREAATWSCCARAAWSDDARDEPLRSALQSAARALDCVSLRASTGGQTTREAGFWAACAFALGGNFPSACVVLKRTFPRLDARSTLVPLSSQRAWKPGVAALVAAFAPSLASLVAEQSPFAARVGKGALDDEDDAIYEVLKDEVGTDWFDLARASFECARALSTRCALDERGGALSGHKWSELLARRVPILLPPQKVALERGFLEREDGALAALPPGTGKTWLGELFLFERLARAESNRGEEQLAPIAVFLVPYVALGRGVAAAFKKHARGLGVDVRVWLSGEGEEDELLNVPTIIVATPERFDGAWRSEPKLSERMCGVVVDEAHLISDGARGARLETLVARLQLARVRTLFLSAATGDATLLGEWIGAPDSLQLSLSWTPTARRLAFWRQDGLEWHGDIAGRGLQMLGHTPFAWPRRELRAGEGWVHTRKQESLVWQNVAHLARARHEDLGGAVLCLCATRRGVRQLARALCAVFPEQSEISGARAQALSLIETRHRTLLPLARMLRHGVAWHSAALPSDLRALIERAVTEGEICALAATRTLAEGVDLPWNQTILADWLGWDERGWHPMESGFCRNIAGRCGRAGAFTEGDTFVFDNPLGPSQWTNPEVRADIQHRQFLDAPRHAPMSSLQARSGEEVAPSIRAAWESGLAALLAWHNSTLGTLGADELKRAFYLPLRDNVRWNETLQNVFDAWLAGDWARVDNDARWTITSRGEALARADLSPATAARLVDALASLPRRAPQTSDDAARLNAHLWHALGQVPEDGDNNALWSARSRFPVRLGDVSLVSRDWLDGTPLPAMFASLERVRSAKDFPGDEALGAWLDGENGAGQRLDESDAEWSGHFDRFSDWARSSLGSWTPRLWRACGALCGLAESRPDLKTWEWNRFAARFAGGVSTDWAVAALRVNAPGGRETLAVWGRAWPFASTNHDALALTPLLRDEPNARERAEEAFIVALREAGGAFCARGASVQALKDWLWARAGATK